jgi:excisionase family DNA binding protein
MKLPVSMQNLDNRNKADFPAVQRLASILGPSWHVNYKLCQAGELPSYRVGGNLRVKVEDFESYMERCRHVGPEGMSGLQRLVIDLLPPRRDELERLIEKDKKRTARSFNLAVQSLCPSSFPEHRMRTQHHPLLGPAPQPMSPAPSSRGC